LPAILAVHVAVPLLVVGVTGKLLLPTNGLLGVWVCVIGLAQTGIGLSFYVSPPFYLTVTGQ
jgi:hypothetical protein